MGFFFRRSTNLGPFRLNFSKSGVGASLGVKGARLTMTPRGTTYITVGSHGFYYRETLGNGGRGSSVPPPLPEPIRPGAVPSGDQIVTADVSELSDSSSEQLVERLNQRARMFNPAWIMYFVAIVTAVVGTTMASSSWNLPSPSASMLGNTNFESPDDYALIVAHYGEPDSILLSEGTGVLTRTAFYESARLRAVFVPAACVEAYQEVSRRSKEPAPRAPKGKVAQQPSAAPNCSASPATWRVVAYRGLTDEDFVADRAQGLLEGMTTMRTGAPVITVEGVSQARRPTSSSATGKRKGVDYAKRPITDKELQNEAHEEQIIQSIVNEERYTSYEQWAAWAASALLFIAGIVLHGQNTKKRTSRLFYELGERERDQFRVVQQAIASLSTARRIWRVESKSATSDWKRNAGASTLLTRSVVSASPSALPPRVETNVSVPCIHLGAVKMFFMPDLILYWEGGTFGAISYSDLRIEQSLTRFIEDGPLTADGTVVDRTWRYVNKNGGPDRRFNNNVQLPVMQYGLLVLTSSRGLNVYLHTSNPQVSIEVAGYWRARQGLGSPPEFGKSPGPRLPNSSTPAFSEQELRACNLLGVAPGAAAEEIASAYRKLAPLYHPDKVAGMATEFQLLADQRMKEINAAYELLKNRRRAV